MSSISTVRSTWFLSFSLILVLISAPATAAWKGKTVEKDGVTRVMNPATAVAAPETVKLKELWRVGGEDDEVLFGVITDVITDRDGNFYLLDSQLLEVQVYAPGGKHLRTIGREGEGPGEFRMAYNLLLLPSGNIGVLQTAPSKIVGLTPEGEPADDFVLPGDGAGGFKLLFGARNAGDQLAVTYGLNEFSEAGFSQNSILALIDASGKTEQRLHSQSSAMKSADAMIAETEWDSFRNRWSSGADGRAYSAVDFGDYTVNVWGPDGKLVHVIHREYAEHVRLGAQMDRVLEIYKGFTRQIPFPNIRYEIEPNWNPIQSINARGDGSLWVRTSRGTFDLADGQLGAFDVFDKNGHLVRQVTLEGQGDPTSDGYFIVADRLFVVTDWLDAMMALQGGASAEDADEDAEPMAIICYQLP